MEIQEVQPLPSARELIDANRRKNQILKIIFPVLIFCAPILYVVTMEDRTESPIYALMYIPIFGWIIYSSISKLFYNDRCPNCQTDISMLPNERSFFWQRLSEKIKMCPSCKVDFSAALVSSEAQNTLVKERQSDATLPAREIINENRKQNTKKLFWVYLWMIGIAIYFVFQVQWEFTAINCLLITSLLIVLVWYGFTHEDDCPHCGEDISNLPSNRSFVFPKLSKKVRNCPYCGADFTESSKQ